MGIGSAVRSVALVLLAPTALALGPTATQWQDASTDAYAAITTGAPTVRLNSISGRSRPNGGSSSTLYDMWAVGDAGLIMHFDPNAKSWSVYTPTPAGAAGVNLHKVYINPNGTGWAVGDGGTILHLSAGGFWSCDNCPNGACAGGQGGAAHSCAVLDDILPTDPLSNTAPVWVVGEASCNPPDTSAPPASAPAGNHATLLYNPTNAPGAWSNLPPCSGPPAGWNLCVNESAWQNDYACPGAGAPPSPGVFQTTGFATSPTTAFTVDSGQLRYPLDEVGSVWRLRDTNTQGVANCTAVPTYYASAVVGVYPLIFGDTIDGPPGTECLGLYAVTSASPASQLPTNAFAWDTNQNPPTRLVRSGMTSTTMYGTIRGATFLTPWGYGIAVGDTVGDANAPTGRDYAAAAGTNAYFGLIEWPDATKYTNEEETITGSNNFIHYEATPALGFSAQTPWARLNGVFIDQYNDAWAVGDVNAATGRPQLLHWTGPSVPPAVLAASVAMTPMGALASGQVVQLTVTATNTGGTAIVNFSPTMAINPGGNLSLVCGPVCSTIYCSPSPVCPTSLAPGGQVTFTWTYSVTACGAPVTFTGGAQGTDLILGTSLKAASSLTAPGPLDAALSLYSTKESEGRYLINVVLTVTNMGNCTATNFLPSAAVTVSPNDGTTLRLGGPSPTVFVGPVNPLPATCGSCNIPTVCSSCYPGDDLDPWSDPNLPASPAGSAPWTSSHATGTACLHFLWSFETTSVAPVTFSAGVSAFTCMSRSNGGSAECTSGGVCFASASSTTRFSGDSGVDAEMFLNRNLFRSTLAAKDPTQALTVTFDIKDTQNVTIMIYNSIGQRVRQLFPSAANPNPAVRRHQYALLWDGTNDAGERVASGVYFVRLEGGTFLPKKAKVALVK